MERFINALPGRRLIVAVLLTVAVVLLVGDQLRWPLAAIAAVVVFVCLRRRNRKELRVDALLAIGAGVVALFLLPLVLLVAGIVLIVVLYLVPVGAIVAAVVAFQRLQNRPRPTRPTTTRGPLPGRDIPSGATEEVVGGTRGWRNANGTFHSAKDGLPTYPASDARIGGALDDVRELRDEIKDSDDPDTKAEAGGCWVLDRLEAEAPEYVQPVLDLVGREDGYVVGRMADASTADGLSSYVRYAFRVWAAIPARTRRALAHDRRAGR